MKKIIIAIMCFFVLLWILLFFFKCYRQFHYLEEDHFSVAVQEDLALAQTGKLEEGYVDYYKKYLNTDIAPLLQQLCPVLLNTRFAPIEKPAAFRMGVFNKIDQNSRVVYLPANYEKEYDISFLQFFQWHEKHYMYCYCGDGNNFLFYIYDDNEELSTLLRNDCFSEENREKLMEPFQKHWYQKGTFSTVFFESWEATAFYLVKRYLFPVCLSLLLFFVPFLLKSKKNTAIPKEAFAFKAAKIGFILVPIIAGICILRIVL